MAREYLIKSLHAQPKFSTFSLQSNSKKLKNHRQFRTNNIFGQTSKHSTSFKKPLSNNLPIRSRPNLEVVMRTRSKTPGPQAFTSGGSQKKAPSTKPAPPTGLEKSEIISKGSQKRASETTENDEDRYAKRLKLEKITSINSDALTNKRKERSQQTINHYFLRYLTRYQRQGRAKLRLDWNRMPVQSQKGMNNHTGAVCYRLSCLQALLHIPVFVNWVMDTLKPADCLSDTKADCVSCCLYELATEYWAGTNMLKTLERFDAILAKKGWASDVDSGFADPEEQVVAIFKFIDEEIPSRNFSVLESITSLKFTDIITCTACGYKSKNHNRTFHNLCLHMGAEYPTFMDYVEHSTKDDLDWSCHSCQKRVDGRRSTEFSHFPELLSVQLKRFEYSMKVGGYAKNRKDVQIPSILDLTKFQSTESTYLSPGRSGKVEYELTAVVSHAGALIGGHYICHSVGADGQWYKYDDSSVTKSSVAMACKNSGPANRAYTFTPYLMYYRKKRQIVSRGHEKINVST
ncbi:hypothetical protein IFR05_016374 [Cadophora sp. M221]|nr:hypothetical protein IFR05_016374 [Cadophora sp. M221]